LGQLALYPADDFLDGEEAHLGDGGAEALPVFTSSEASSNWLCEMTLSRSIISPRLSWRSLLVAKTSWPPSKKSWRSTRPNTSWSWPVRRAE